MSVIAHNSVRHPEFISGSGVQVACFQGTLDTDPAAAGQHDVLINDMTQNGHS